MDFSDLLARHDYKHPRLVHDALGYAAIGLRVIPLGKRRKQPWMQRWPERGTCDPHQIVAWFERWPEDNIGILTGGGLIVLDIDPRNGGTRSFQMLLGRRKLPVTAQARTGSGGDHYLFRVDPTLEVGNINGLRPGIDIKGEGGQFVVEPSVHPATGREYAWLRHPRDGIAEAPAWLVREITKHRAKRHRANEASPPLACTREGDEGRLLDEMIGKFPVDGPGQRNAKMHRAVASLICRGYERGLVHRVLMGWYDHFHALGRIATGRAEMERLLRACIEATLRSKTLRPSVSVVDHRARIAQVALGEEQVDLIRDGFILGAERGISLPNGSEDSPHLVIE